ncbi:hypothetical protein ACSDR0_01195 [Streptosporangium sp. G11]|uniref:hypothetical protein n=1 Tax=Streptosporangium sp. G11 TaxID=3436926 RepID=UPI003EB962AF
MYQTTGIESHQGTKCGTVRRLCLIAAGISTALPLIVSVPAPVGATSALRETTPSPADNCVVDVVAGATKASTERCFSTFTEAIRFATDGAITNAPPTAIEGVDDPALNALLGSTEKSDDPQESTAPAGALIVIGIEYEHANYGGASYTFRGSRRCTTPTTDIDYSLNLPRHWWDRISSFRNYNNCFTNHYAFSGFVPPSTGYLNDRAVMPIIGGRNFNDDARSIRWS